MIEPLKIVPAGFRRRERLRLRTGLHQIHRGFRWWPHIRGRRLGRPLGRGRQRST